MSVAVDLVRVSPSWTIPPLVRRGVLGGQLPEGFRIGELVVVELRGVDANCELYLARHVVDEVMYTVRVVRRALLTDHPVLAESMLASARLLCNSRHPHLPAVFACGWTDEASPRPYVAHERLVGRDLATYQARHGRLDPSLLLAVAAQCAAALDALHRLGLAHTDLRRSCVMLVPAGGDRFEVKLGGLEHARPIRPGATADHEPLVAADLAALGVMLRELASGTDGVVAAELGRASAWMTDIQPGQRPGSAGEVQAAIARLCAELPGDSLTSRVADAIALGVVHTGEAARGASPGAPRGRATGPWARLSVLVLGAAAFVVAVTSGVLSPARSPEPQRLHSLAEEPTAAFVASRRVPERAEEPVRAVDGSGPSVEGPDQEEAARVMAAGSRVRREITSPAREVTPPAAEVAAAELDVQAPVPPLAEATSDPRVDTFGVKGGTLLPLAETIAPGEPPYDELGLLPVGTRIARADDVERPRDPSRH